MNHSCCPNVIVTYKGTLAEVRAVQEIHPGEEVSAWPRAAVAVGTILSPSRVQDQTCGMIQTFGFHLALAMSICGQEKETREE